MEQQENFTLRVDKMSKEYFQSQNTDVITVTYSITQKTQDGDEEVVMQNIQAFPLEISKEELQSELQKILATFISDRQLARANTDRDRAQANADDLIQSFQGQKFSIELHEKVGVQAESQ